MPSNPNVHTNRSGRTISRYSPKNTGVSRSGPRCAILQAPPGRKSISHFTTSWFLGPHQCDMCSHELCASNTSSRGASKTRVMTIFRSGVASVCLYLPSSPIALLLSLAWTSSLELVQVLVQSVVALLPEAAVPVGPLGDLLQRDRPQPRGPPLPLPSP